jgi:hypothetical protein
MNINTNTAIDINTINYSSIGRKSRAIDLITFIADKVLHKVPETAEMVQISGAHKVIFTKTGRKVQAHYIKIIGLNVSVAPAPLNEVSNLTPDAFKTKPVKEDKFRTVFDDQGNVLRQAPISKVIDKDHIWQLEVLANEFITMNPLTDFGIHLRAAMWKGKPVSLMMTVYTSESGEVRTASDKKVKINLLSNPDKLDEWLSHIQKVYDDCAERLLDKPLESEGFLFDRRALVDMGEMVIVGLTKNIELTADVVNQLRKFSV